jgi:hypothetical protein
MATLINILNITDVSLSAFRIIFCDNYKTDTLGLFKSVSSLFEEKFNLGKVFDGVKVYCKEKYCYYGNEN